MKKIIILFLYSIILHSCNDIFDQLPNEESDITTRGVDVSEVKVVCSTPNPVPQAWMFLPQSKSSEEYEIKEFNVFIHLIRDTNGFGYGFYKDEVSQTIISQLNYYFDDANIIFSLAGSDYIDSDHYNRLSLRDDLNGLFNVNNHSDALNIYVLTSGDDKENSDGSITVGRAQNIPSTSCAILQYYYQFPTIAHEIGHCLGLYHTHHGTSINEPGSDPEYVDGSNAATAGDYIIDTPADPCIWDNSIGYCQYEITATDAKGLTYQPDPYNLMCYSSLLCMSIFTDNQIDRMHTAIEHYAPLNAALKRATIEGPTHFCSNALYSIKNEGNAISNVTWKVNSTYWDQYGSQSSSTNESSGTTLTLNTNSVGSLRPGLHKISAEVTYTDGRKVSANSIQVTSGETSPYVGTLYWNCGYVKNGQTSHSMNNGSIEIESNGTKTFTATRYYDKAGNDILNPSIDMFALDLEGTRNGNTIQISPIYGGSVEGDLEIYVFNDCTVDGVPFIIPYTVFDVNEMSLHVAGNTLTIAPNASNEAGSVSAQSTSRTEESISMVQILTTDKQPVTSQHFTTGSNVVSMDISSLPAGKYYVKIFKGERTLFKKLTVN